MTFRDAVPSSLVLTVLCALGARAEAPLSLTASDGSGLSLVGLEANAVVTEPLAFTELHLTFQNPAERVIEGQFRIVLPQHAVVSRFAMKQDARWQEGEVVEKQAARRAYEDALHRRQDPALLEQGAANEFSARVFPIPARGTKELIISYSQQLVSSQTPYVLPLKGLPQVANLSATVHAGGPPVTLSKTAYVPNSDLVVALPPGSHAGLRTGDFAVIRVKPVADAAAQSLDSVLFLVDSSASRALGYAAQLALLDKVLAKLKPSTAVTVVAFDQLTQTIYDGPASGYGADAKKLLRERRALGASNLEAALALAPSLKRTRVVLVSDGVVTAGTDGPDELAAKVKGLKAAGIVRLDAIAVGGLRDDAMLHRLVTAGLPQDGAVIDSDAGEADIVRRLEATTRSKIPVAVEGATFQWPKVLDAMQTGDEALIFAEVPKGQPVRIKVGGQTVDTGGLGEVSVAMLERAVAQAKIESLTDAMNRAADGPKDKERYKAEITGLSTKYRVLSPFTALLVLETEADYARFGIDRKALADVLGIENGRVIARHRAPEPEAPKVAVASPSKPQPAKAPVEKKAMRREAAPSAAAAATDDSFGSPKGGEVEVAEEEASKEKRDESTMAESAPSLEAPSAPPPPRPSAPAPASSARLGSSAGAPGGGSAAGGVRADRRAVASPPRDEISDGEASAGDTNGDSERPQHGPPPYTGPLKDVMALLSAKKANDAMTKALGWREEDPGDVLALIAIGEAAEALHDLDRAARAYGSIIDLFPARADLRRYAGARLERLANGLGLATDTFRHALDQRPDHPESARLLAYALLKQGKAEQAFTILATARARSYPSGRFAGIERILSEDLGLAAAVWAKQSPGLKTDIENKLKLAKGTTEAGKSIRFVLNWETDANDVDFHIFDAKGGHAFYSQPHLRTGGDLYADVTTGYGPECFTIRGQRTGPYTLQAHYYSRGPMGYGLGKLEIVEHDGQGTLKFEERPFVVMVDSAFVDLGTVR